MRDVPTVRYWIFPVTEATEGLRGWYRTRAAGEAAASELWRTASRWTGLTVVGGTDRADATARARRVMARAALPADAQFMKPSTYRYAAAQ